MNGGHRQSGSQLWYRGKDLPDGSLEEFDKDCGMTLADLADVFPLLSQRSCFCLHGH